MSIELGTLIHGTLRTRDLLEAFTGELERLDTEKFYASDIAQAYAWLELSEREFDGTQIDIDATEYVHDFMTYLNDYAPDGYYFGSIEGDGSDFGFWQDEITGMFP